MRYEQIVRSKEGKERHIVNVDDIKIHDLWHTAIRITDMVEGEEVALTQVDADMVIETWALCHDLLNHIKRVCREPKQE